MHTVSLKEKIADAIMYIFAIIPLTIVALASIVCTPESFGVRECIGGNFGDNFFNFFMAYAFFAAVGGFITLPILIVASVISLRAKSKRIDLVRASRERLLLAPTFIFIYIFIIATLLK